MTEPGRRVELAMSPDLPEKLFPAPIAHRLMAAADVDLGRPLTEFTSDAARARLAQTRILLTGWGSPVIDEAALAHAVRLEAVVHAAGTIKSHVSAAVFARGIPVSSAASANALPVAEYTVAMILLANKAVPALAREYRRRRAEIDLMGEFPDVGNYGKTVGLVGASKIGRRVLELLAPFDLEVLIGSPPCGPGQR